MAGLIIYRYVLGHSWQSACRGRHSEYSIATRGAASHRYIGAVWSRRPPRLGAVPLSGRHNY